MVRTFTWCIFVDRWSLILKNLLLATATLARTNFQRGTHGIYLSASQKSKKPESSIILSVCHYGETVACRPHNKTTIWPPIDHGKESMGLPGPNPNDASIGYQHGGSGLVCPLTVKRETEF